MSHGCDYCDEDAPCTCAGFADAAEMREYFNYVVPPDQSPQVNVPLLRKVAEWVAWNASLPEDSTLLEWNQGAWITVTSDNGYRHTVHNVELLNDPVKRQALNCRTSYCCAGYAVSLDPSVVWVTDTAVTDKRTDQTWEIQDWAAEALGLTFVERNTLFDGDNDAETIQMVVDAVMLRTGEKL